MASRLRTGVLGLCAALTLVTVVGGCGDDVVNDYGLAVVPKRATVPAGFTVQFTALNAEIDVDLGTSHIVDAGSPAVTWSSSDTSIATVDQNGLARALKAGAVTITAATDKATATAKLTVTSEALTKIVVTPDKVKVPVGAQQAFVAMGTFSDGTTRDVSTAVTWASSDDSVATVDAMGQTNAASEGTAIITASAEGLDTTLDAGVQKTLSGTATLTVTAASIKSIAIEPAAPMVPAGLRQQLTAVGTYSDGTVGDVTSLVRWASSDETVATVSNDAGKKGLAAALIAGTAEITATLGATVGTVTFTVIGSPLKAIAVTPVNPILAAGTTAQLKATATFADGTVQDVTGQADWTTSDDKVATVSSADPTRGLVGGVKVGDATITAALYGVSGATRVHVTLANLVSIQITPPDPRAAVGTTVALVATGTFSDSSTQDLTRSAAWSSDDVKIATVDDAAKKGLAAGVAIGTVTIRAKQAGVEGQITLQVTEANLTAIEVSPANPVIAKGTTQAFVATGIYGDKSRQDLTTLVTWSSSDAKVATVSNTAPTRGVATGAGTGSSSIKATLGTVSGATTLFVNAATLVSIEVSPPSPSVAKGTTQQFQAVGTYSDGSTQDLTSLVTWASSDTKIAAVSNAAGTQGLTSTPGVGMTTISASLGTIKGSTGFTVTDAVLKSIAVTPANPTAAKGTTQQFQATGTYSDNTTQTITNLVTWATVDTMVASISNAAGSRGLASALAVGRTDVTATMGTVVGTTAFTVTSATLQSISIAPPAPSIARGTAISLTATGIYSDGSNQDLTTACYWTSSRTTVATVSNSAGSQGRAAAVAVGSTTINCAYGGRNGSTTLTVNTATLSSITIDPATPTLPALGYERQFNAWGNMTDGSKQMLTTQVTWSSSMTGVATVSNASGKQGLVTTASPGATTLSAAFNGVTGTTVVTVKGSTLNSMVVYPGNVSLPVGYQQAFTALGYFSDGSSLWITSQVSWSVSNGAVGSISNAPGSQGLATALAGGSTTVTAVKNGISASRTMTVTTAKLTAIEITPANVSLNRGLTQQYLAMGKYSDGTNKEITLQVTWLTGDGNVASVSNAAGSRGLLTGLAAGMTTVEATLSGIAGRTNVTVR